MILFENDISIYIGSINPASHAHHALEISIAYSTTIALHCEGRKINDIKGCIIFPGKKHKPIIKPNKGEKITILLDADLPITRYICQKLNAKKKTHQIIDVKPLIPLLDKLMAERKKTEKGASKKIYHLIDEILYLLFPGFDQKKLKTFDKRIINVISYVKENIQSQTFNFKEIADLHELSESRLAHLFKQEIGIPFRKYVLWVRLKVAVSNVLRGVSITQAAYIAGFSDASHFSKVYFKMFGLKPSVPLRDIK